MQHYCSTTSTKIPGLFTEISEINNSTQQNTSKAAEKLQIISQAAPQHKQSSTAPMSPSGMGGKKKSMPDALVKTARPLMKKDHHNSKSLNKQQFGNGVKLSESTNTPIVKSPLPRVQSPIRGAVQNKQNQPPPLPTPILHSPLDSQESTHIKVYARFRPANKMENELTRNGLGNECVIFPDEYTVVLQPDNMVFTFDRTFDIDCNQELVYQTIGSSAIQDVLDGYNGTIFAYGQTGSGKTYSMFGELRDDFLKGIIPRSIEEIFDFINKSDSEVDFILTCSMLEIYKETLYDLLSINRPDLKIKECPQRGIYVENLTQLSLSSQNELLRIVELGEQTRKVGATRINQYSSRSHTIFMLEVRQKYTNDTEKKGKLNLVDLAGSEKVGKTGAIGEILEEAKKINLSLSCLGNVIHAITTGNEHVPYRNSKVTRVLQESLGGNYKTSLIVTCSSHSSSLEETISTLKFASRTKSIKNHFKVNMKVPYEVQQQIILQLRQELSTTTQELTDLKSQIETIKRRSILDIPSEDINSMEMQNKYNSRTLSNQEKPCFKKHSFQTNEPPQNISNIIPPSDAKSFIKGNPNNHSQQQSSTIDLSFFSQKKPSSSDVDVRGLLDQQMSLQKQLDTLNEQYQYIKQEGTKKDQKILYLQQRVQHLEKAANQNKENASFGVVSFTQSFIKNSKDSNEILKSLQMNLKGNQFSQDIQSNLKQLEEKLQQTEQQMAQMNELNTMLFSENNYLNKQLELIDQQTQQDRYFQGLVREKIETMNIEYYRKVEHLLNGEISNSRIVKMINSTRGQTEEIVKKLSRKNFANCVYRIVSKELQDILKNLNPELVKKSLGSVFDSILSSQLDSALMDLFSQYDANKVRGSEDRLKAELLDQEKKLLNERLIVQEQQLQQMSSKIEKFQELLLCKNLTHRQKLMEQVDYINRINYQTINNQNPKNTQRQTLFRFDYGLE